MFSVLGAISKRCSLASINSLLLKAILSRGLFAWNLFKTDFFFPVETGAADAVVLCGWCALSKITAALFSACQLTTMTSAEKWKNENKKKKQQKQFVPHRLTWRWVNRGDSVLVVLWVEVSPWLFLQNDLTAGQQPHDPVQALAARGSVRQIGIGILDAGTHYGILMPGES